MSPDPKRLLDAAIRHDWLALRLETGLSPTRLTQLALRAIDDPEVIAAYPLECGQLRRRREASRARRSAQLP